MTDVPTGQGQKTAELSAAEEQVAGRDHHRAPPSTNALVRAIAPANGLMVCALVRAFAVVSAKLPQEWVLRFAGCQRDLRGYDGGWVWPGGDRVEVKAGDFGQVAGEPRDP